MNKTTGATLLRTLSEKSTLKFGRNAEIPLWKLMEQAHGKAYLMWVYYHCSMINFSDSILAALHISGEDLIPKPGTDKEIYNRKFKSIMKWKFARHGHKGTTVRKRNAKKKLLNLAYRSHLTKGQLRERNVKR